MKRCLLLIAAILALASAGCARRAPTPVTAPTLPGEVSTNVPAPTVTATPSEAPTASASVEAFETRLTETLAAHNFGLLPPLMGDPFIFGLWQSEGVEQSPAAAAERLRTDLLSSSAPLRFDRPSTQGLTDLLGGADPYALWGPNVSIASLLYSEGWGADGKGQALLAIAQTPDGSFHWHGVLFAPHGFQAPLSLEAFEASLELALTEQRFEDLPSYMGDDLTIAGWLSEGVAWPAKDAADQLRQHYLMPAATLTFDKPSEADLTKLLNGTDPYTMAALGVTVASVLESKGWGPEGKLVAFLVIAERPEGSYYWTAVLLAHQDLLAPKPTTKPATAVPPTAAPPTATPPALAITSFTCNAEDIASGKRLTFAWATTGATKARILSGTSVRFPPGWEVPPNGTLTVEVATTYYRNPSMTLIAGDGAGHEVNKSVTVNWACKFSYFFANPPAACPQGEAVSVQAAQEAFEHGRMIWLKQVPGGAAKGQIIVLYADKTWKQFEDTFVEGDPESDPSIVPPSGLFQPIRGFGKVWRTREGVRSKLGWAKAPEEAYTATWQWQMRESLPNVAYLKAAGGQVIELTGMTDGTWKAIEQ